MGHTCAAALDCQADQPQNQQDRNRPGMAPNTWTPRIYFTDPGCTGGAYFDNFDVHYCPFALVSIGPPGVTVYRQGEEVPFVPFLAWSAFDGSGCTSYATSRPGQGKSALPLTQLNFTPPFRVVMVP